MKSLDILMPALLLALTAGFGVALGGEVIADCATYPLISVNELHRTACKKLESISIEFCLSPKSSSPYATALDQRELAVAYGKNEFAVKVALGATNCQPPRICESRILQPPQAYQVSAIERLQKAQKYGAWTISTEQVEYGAEGGRLGFALICATAIRSRRKETIGVAECFPFEEKDRFMQALISAR